MMDWAQVEKLFPFLSKIEPERAARLRECLRYRKMEEGEKLTEHGPCETVPLVLSGVLRVFRVSENGREITLFRAGAGDTCIIRMACHFGNQELSVQAIAQEPCELLTLSDQDYLEILADDPAWKDFVIETLYGRLTETIGVLEQVAFSSIDKRLVRVLYRMCGGEKSTILMTHEQMAAELGTVREVVSRLLGELKRRGIVSLGHGKVTVLEPEMLREILEDCDRTHRLSSGKLVR